MNVWAWRWGRLAWCKKHYDQIINWEHVVWGLWLRKKPTDLLLERIAAEDRIEQDRQDDWWEQRKIEALAESKAVDAELDGAEVFQYVYDPSNQVTDLAEPGHIPIPDTDIVRARAP